MEKNLQMDVRIAVTDGSNVALEMADINGIESDLGNRRISIPCNMSSRLDKMLTMVTKSRISASVRRSPMR
jgi:hypothetical protein